MKLSISTTASLVLCSLLSTTHGATPVDVALKRHKRPAFAVEKQADAIDTKKNNQLKKNYSL